MMCHFNGNPNTTVLCCYSPTNYANEDDIVTFYNDLRETVKAIPRHNIQLILGDMNARIGTDRAKYTTNKETNRNGEQLINFCEESDYIIGNTRFQKNKNRLWTARLPNGHKVQIDYIMINRKWQNSIHNIQAYNTFNTVGSDHRIVTASICLSLRAQKTRPKSIKYNWDY